MAQLPSDSAATAAGGLETLAFMKSHFEWTRWPDLPAKMDRAVLAAAEKVARMTDGPAHSALCRYLGSVKTEESRKRLWQLTEDPAAREQALIGLCWIADREDMPRLGQALVKGGKGAMSLPHHLFRAYGTDSLPHIRKAARQSGDPHVREQCRQALLKIGESSSRP